MNNEDQTILSEFISSKNLIEVFVRNSKLLVIAKFNDLSSEEIETIRDNDFLWKVIRIAKLSYLCFSPVGYSWNEILLSNKNKNQDLEALFTYDQETIQIHFLGVLEETGEIFTDRDFTLDEFETENLLSAIESQEFLTEKEYEDMNLLGDPAPLLKAMQSENLPNISNIEIDQENRVTKIEVKSMPTRLLNEPRARWILRHWENIFKNDRMRMYMEMLESFANRNIKRQWDHCLLPVGVFQELEEAEMRRNISQQLKRIGQAHLIEEYLAKLPEGYYSAIYAAMLFSWRFSKGVYKFDDDVLKSIYLASLPVHLDAKIFTKLPEYCVYIETPGMSDWNGSPIQGFFAMTEKTIFFSGDEENQSYVDFFESGKELDFADSDYNLYLLIDGGSTDKSRDGQTHILKMDILDGTLEECLESIELVEPLPNQRNPHFDELIQWVSPFLSQLLYLCSEEPEIEHSKDKEIKPGTEDVKKTKKGLRIFTPTKVNEWLCGWRTGSFIKQQRNIDNEKSDESGDGESSRTVRSHLRRAHWHTFYAGKRDAPKKEVRVKWLQMIKVKFDGNDTDNLPTVIKKVS